MLGISGTELVIILIFGFLIFGPDRLPAMGRTIGRALRQFQQAQDQMNKMVKTEIYDPINEAAKAPIKKQGPKKKTTSGSAASKPETFAEKKARLAAEAQAKTVARVSGTADSAEQTSDVPAVPERPVGRSETFAEKKARLEAEKAAAASKDDAKRRADATIAGQTRVRTAASGKKKVGTSSKSSFKLYDLGQVSAPEAGAPKSDAAKPATSGKGDQEEA